MPEPPGARAIRRFLRRHHGLMPPAHRSSLALGLALVAGYAALQAILAIVDPVLGRDLLRLFALTLVAGREPALFAVYHTSHPVPVAWAAGMAALDDLATLLLAVPFTWLLVDRLRRVPALDAVLRSFERALNAHRGAVDRWGVLGLAGFLWLPGVGTGPTVAGAMGVLAGIPTRRLLLALGASSVAVNVFWAVALAETAQATPAGGPWDFLPLAVVAAVLAFAAVSTARRHRHRFVLEYRLPPPDVVDPPRLAAWGFERHGEVLRLDARGLAALGGPPAGRLAQCHWAGELLLLPSMDPPWAGRLATLGVGGIHDLSVVPADLLAQALGVEPAGLARVEAWRRDAHAWLAAMAR